VVLQAGCSGLQAGCGGLQAGCGGLQAGLQAGLQGPARLDLGEVLVRLLEVPRHRVLLHLGQRVGRARLKVLEDWLDLVRVRVRVRVRVWVWVWVWVWVRVRVSLTCSIQVSSSSSPTLSIVISHGGGCSPGAPGARMYSPFSATSQSGRSPNHSFISARSRPEQTTTVLRSLEARAARLRRSEGRILSRLAKRA
jgi:hypothetical protein